MFSTMLRLWKVNASSLPYVPMHFLPDTLLESKGIVGRKKSTSDKKLGINTGTYHPFERTEYIYCCE